MICEKCGKQMPLWDNYCPHCGTKVKRVFKGGTAAPGATSGAPPFVKNRSPLVAKPKPNISESNPPGNWKRVAVYIAGFFITPTVGVFYLGWDAYRLLVMYWMDLAFFYLFKMAREILAQRNIARKDIDPNSILTSVSILFLHFFVQTVFVLFIGYETDCFRHIISNTDSIEKIPEMYVLLRYIGENGLLLGAAGMFFYRALAFADFCRRGVTDKPDDWQDIPPDLVYREVMPILITVATNLTVLCLMQMGLPRPMALLVAAIKIPMEIRWMTKPGSSRARDAGERPHATLLRRLRNIFWRIFGLIVIIGISSLATVFMFFTILSGRIDARSFKPSMGKIQEVYFEEHVVFDATGQRQKTYFVPYISYTYKVVGDDYDHAGVMQGNDMDLPLDAAIAKLNVKRRLRITGCDKNTVVVYGQVRHKCAFNDADIIVYFDPIESFTPFTHMHGNSVLERSHPWRYYNYNMYTFSMICMSIAILAGIAAALTWHIGVATRKQ